MEDMERYGDYTEYEEDIPKSKSKFVLTMKILIAFVCISVLGVLAFRIVLFNTYPDSMKDIYFTDNLTDYYNATDGDINAKTQMIRFPYDDEDKGNFFGANLIVIEGAGEIQFSVRYNLSTLETIEKQYGLKDLSPDDETLFSFKLVRPDPESKSDPVETIVVSENPSYIETDSRVMYRYFKLAFDGIDFEYPPAWLRVEIFVKGHEDEPFAMILVYENHEDFAIFEEYDLGRKERPE